MLENAGVTGFTVSELIRGGWGSRWEGEVRLPPPTQIRVNSGFYSKFSSKIIRFFVYSARNSPNSSFNKGITAVF